MSEITIRICDRCKGRIDTSKRWTQVTKLKPKRHKILTRFGYGPYNYHEETIELCNSCDDKFNQFMRAEG